MLIIIRPVSIRVTDAETGDSTDVVVQSEFPVMLEGDQLYYVRQGQAGAKVGSLDSEAVEAIKQLGS